MWKKAFMSIIDGICLAFIEGNCYNSSSFIRWSRIFEKKLSCKKRERFRRHI